MLIKHNQTFKRGYYSKIWNRAIVGAAEGATRITLWDQVIPPGGYIVPHSHTFEETLTLLSGQAQVTIDGVDTVAGANETIFVAPGVVHALRNEGATSVRLLAVLATDQPAIDYVTPPTPAAWLDTEAPPS